MTIQYIFVSLYKSRYIDLKLFKSKIIMYFYIDIMKLLDSIIK